MVKRIISGVLAVSIAFLAVPALAADPVANPLLSDACGLDIMLVLDRSGSIDSTEMAQMNTAAKAFVDAFLPSTPTFMGVVNFASGAVLDQALTSNVTDIKAKIDTPSSVGTLTNWEAAILTAKAELEGGNDRADATNPDLLIMFSDGDPTTSSGPLSDMDDAIVAANGAKTSAATMPIRVLGVGIGSSVTVTSFEQITNGIGTSSIVPPDGVTKDTDVILADFGTLATTLGNLANALCAPADHEDPCCGGDTTVKNKNEATVINVVEAGANTGGNKAKGSTGGDGGQGGTIANSNGDQNVNYAATGNGGNGGNGGVGGTVDTGNADASATLTNNINHSTTTIDRCQCPGNECKGGDDVVRNRNSALVVDGVGAGANSGDNKAKGSRGGQGSDGGAVQNTGGNQNVNNAGTGQGGAGGTGDEGGIVRTGKATSRSTVTNNINRNVTTIGR